MPSKLFIIILACSTALAEDWRDSCEKLEETIHERCTTKKRWEDLRCLINPANYDREFPLERLKDKAPWTERWLMFRPYEFNHYRQGILKSIPIEKMTIALLQERDVYNKTLKETEGVGCQYTQKTVYVRRNILTHHSYCDRIENYSRKIPFPDGVKQNFLDKDHNFNKYAGRIPDYFNLPEIKDDEFYDGPNGFLGDHSIVKTSDNFRFVDWEKREYSEACKRVKIEELEVQELAILKAYNEMSTYGTSFMTCILDSEYAYIFTRAYYYVLSHKKMNCRWMAQTTETRLRAYYNIVNAVLDLHDMGIVHNDLSPTHVLFDFYYNPHLIDFGSADFVTRPDRLTGLKHSLFVNPKRLQAGSTNKFFHDVYSICMMIIAMESRRGYQYINMRHGAQFVSEGYSVRMEYPKMPKEDKEQHVLKHLNEMLSTSHFGKIEENVIDPFHMNLATLLYRVVIELDESITMKALKSRLAAYITWTRMGKIKKYILNECTLVQPGMTNWDTIEYLEGITMTDEQRKEYEKKFH